MSGSSTASSWNLVARAIPCSTGSGPKFALIISQAMLSARSARRLPRSAYSSACRQASSPDPLNPSASLRPAEQVPRLSEGERIPELFRGPQRHVHVVEEPCAATAEHAERGKAEEGPGWPAACQRDRILECPLSLRHVAAGRPERPHRGPEAQQELPVRALASPADRSPQVRVVVEEARDRCGLVARP